MKLDKIQTCIFTLTFHFKKWSGNLTKHLRINKQIALVNIVLVSRDVLWYTKLISISMCQEMSCDASNWYSSVWVKRCLMMHQIDIHQYVSRDVLWYNKFIFISMCQEMFCDTSNWYSSVCIKRHFLILREVEKIFQCQRGESVSIRMLF